MERKDLTGSNVSHLMNHSHCCLSCGGSHPCEKKRKKRTALTKALTLLCSLLPIWQCWQIRWTRKSWKIRDTTWCCEVRRIWRNRLRKASPPLVPLTRQPLSAAHLKREEATFLELRRLGEREIERPHTNVVEDTLDFLGETDPGSGNHKLPLNFVSLQFGFSL